MSILGAGARFAGGVIRKSGNAIVSGGTASGVGKLAAGSFILDAGYNLSQGDGLGTSVVKATATGALAASNPWIYGVGTVASIGTDAAWGFEKFKMQKQQWWSSQYATNNRIGGNYVDTQRAQTMRQAAIQQIQGSKLNARSALGGEAKILNPYSQRR